jgi:two-component system NtrC family sensor kinase
MSFINKDLRSMVTLRALVAVGLACLTLAADPGSAFGLRGWVLLAFLLSNAAVLAVRRPGSGRVLDLALITLDTAILSVFLYPHGGSNLALVFFMVLLLVALGRGKPVQLVSATIVAGLDGWLAVRTGAPISPALLLRLPFFYSVALYYGSFVDRVRDEREEAQRVRAESEELRTVVTILEDIGSSIDLESVMKRVVQQIAGVVPAERVSVLLLDQQGRTATVVACNDQVTPGRIEIDLDRYPEIRMAVDDRKLVVLEDLLRHPVVEPVREQLRHIGFNSVMVIPLIFGDEALGSLVLKASSFQMRFRTDQVRFCQAVATAAANALKNSLLHREATRLADRYRSTTAELENILGQSPDLIVTTDAEGRVLRWNRGAERLLGHMADEVYGRPIGDFVSGWSEGAVTRALAADGRWCDHQAELRRANGSTLETDLTVVPLGDADRNGLLVVARDVTEINAGRRALMHADRLTGLGEIISGVAHELKNPLAGVLGHAQLLESEELGDNARRDVRSIVENARRCRRVVRNLLGFARRHREEEVLAPITGVLDTVLDLCSYQTKTQNIRVEREYAPALPLTVLDPHRMEHVFVNLVQNAMHALARDGRGGTIRVGASHENGELVIVVSDDGPGIPSDLAAGIFDPFFTTKTEGTGLGLSIAAGIVADHGGRMAHHPVPGGGASFYVYLPVREDASDEDAGEDIDPAAAADGAA